jgi:hypothetical protein
MNPNKVSGLIIPAEAEAAVIERTLQDFLIKPQPGLYTSRSRTPVIACNRSYHYHLLHEPDALPLLSFDQLLDPRDQRINVVYDIDGEVAWNRHHHGPLFTTPQRPTVGLAIMRDFFDNFIARRLPWVKVKPDLGMALEKYIIPEMRQVSIAVLDAEDLFSRKNYAMSNRVLIDTPKYGPTWVPVDLIEVERANPVMEWIEEYLFCEMAMERASVAHLLELDVNANYTVEIRDDTLRIMHGGDHRAAEQDTTDSPSEHQQPTRVPTTTEVERSHRAKCAEGVSERTLPPGLNRKSVKGDKPKNVGTLEEVTDTIRMKANIHDHI